MNFDCLSIAPTALAASAKPNFGVTNAAQVGTGRHAYFHNGNWQMIIVSEPKAALCSASGLLCPLPRHHA